MNCHISFIQKRFDEEHDPSEFFLLLATETDIVLQYENFDRHLKQEHENQLKALGWNFDA